MANSVVVSESLVMPLPVEQAFARTLPVPLTQVFSRRHGLFPPIQEVCDQTGAWDAAGRTRTVVMAAGGTEVTWRWDIHPRSPLSALMLPVFGRMWKGYARQALRELSGMLTR
ncbi:SRPBCC family protein [Mycobacterium stomatepiae]|uniref:Polyketide cyclase n=1 Tax=Mycobacterium stomatepiae TaxID=470076 RepID=A0A7I7QEW3_9MYCO|nr:SRPBCC family protein [Mycobacterium stomatepiae]MCV7162864.1 SRPBCC family protein [Mycobacterium stomatepiae]BBY24894.1 hypothetical protein MSTO_50990 [Mycobacterium stomatepiae]